MLMLCYILVNVKQGHVFDLTYREKATVYWSVHDKHERKD